MPPRESGSGRLGQLGTSANKKRAPPTDRGELHIGGVAVFTRPFSGLLNTLTHPFSESCAPSRNVLKFDKISPPRRSSNQTGTGHPIALKRAIPARNQHGYGSCEAQSVVRMRMESLVQSPCLQEESEAYCGDSILAMRCGDR